MVWLYGVCHLDRNTYLRFYEPWPLAALLTTRHVRLFTLVTSALEYQVKVLTLMTQTSMASSTSDQQTKSQVPKAVSLHSWICYSNPYFTSLLQEYNWNSLNLVFRAWCDLFGIRDWIQNLTFVRQALWPHPSCPWRLFLNKIYCICIVD